MTFKFNLRILLIRMYQICDTSQSLDNQYYQMALIMDTDSLPKTSDSNLNTETLKNSKKNDQPIINEFHTLMNQHKIQENSAAEFNSDKKSNIRLVDVHNNNQKKNTGKLYFPKQIKLLDNFNPFMLNFINDVFLNKNKSQ